MQSKEDVLKKYPHSLGAVLHYRKPVVLQAMEEYASQFQPPQPSKDVDPFIEKHLAKIRDRTIDGLIHTRIEKMWGSLEMASVNHFIETGKVNGSFYLRLKEILKIAYKWNNHPEQGKESPSKDVEQAAKELADELAETVQHDMDDIHQSLVYVFIAGAKWAEQGKEATPVDGKFKEKAIASLQKFYELGDEIGYSNSELSRIRSCIEKIREIHETPTPVKGKEECVHLPLIDTGIGYYICPECNQWWNYDEYNNSRKSTHVSDIQQKYADYLGHKSEMDTSDADAVEWTSKTILKGANDVFNTGDEK